MTVNCFKSLNFERNLEIGLILVVKMSRFYALILGAFGTNIWKYFKCEPPITVEYFRRYSEFHECVM